MAPLKKRKVADADPTSIPTKRTKIEKRPKEDKASKGNDDDQSQARTQDSPFSETTKNSTQFTAIQQDQGAFPRGGGGILTPLERKQIHIKAHQDALAEHNGASDLFGDHGPGVVDSDDAQNEAEVPKLKESRKKIKGRNKSRTLLEPASTEKLRLRIEGLKHKRLHPGCLVLGQISRIGPQGLTLALPNNLFGHVPITAISQQINEKLQALLDHDQANNDDVELDLENTVVLSDYFFVGQFLRAAVVSSEGDAAESKKKVNLSIQPELSNLPLKKSDLTAGCTIQVSVTSIEDHGLVVDPGLEGGGVSGFIANSELDEGHDFETIKTGAVLLCMITDVGSNRRTLKLSASASKLSTTAKKLVLKESSSIDCFLPGTSVEVLVSDVTTSGIKGTIMGMLDATADVVHSSACQSNEDLQERFSVGQKIVGRIIFTQQSADEPSVSVSMVPHLLHWHSAVNKDDHPSIPLSTIIEDAEVIRVESGLGVYLRIAELTVAFAHTSRLSDQKVDALLASSGPYKLGSKHKARILEYSPMDDLYLVSLQESVLTKPFLRMEDVQIGIIVKGTIKKLLIGEKGIKGLIVALTDDVDGLVPEIHLSDIKLQHPEKKFREGLTVSARVISTDSSRRQIRLTLKKTLVNSESKIWKDYQDISVGDSTPGTILKVERNGALVQFYGSVKGFLPVSEMSEAYVKDATEHFRTGQVVTVTAISIDPAKPRLTLSCRDQSSDHQSVESALNSLEVGSFVNGVCFEKVEDDLLLRLEPSNVVGRLSIDFIADGSERKRQAALSKIRVGQTLQDLMIVDVHVKRRLVIVANRPSLANACREGTFLKKFEDLREGVKVTGFVTNVTASGVYVGFGSGISALMSKTQISKEKLDQQDFGFSKFSVVTSTVQSIDYKTQPPRIWLTMKEQVADSSQKRVTSTDDKSDLDQPITDPVDDQLRSQEDLRVGNVLKARIASIKETQLNVELASGIQGRIDVSQIFDTWDEIKDRKKPLKKFSVGGIIATKILGIHDARNHRFLPISHRSNKTSVFELSAKQSVITNPQVGLPSLANMKPESSWLAFVNNIINDTIWVNITPNVRGRLRAIDASDDLSVAGDLEQHFPVGSAIRVKVVSVDVDKGRLDLSARRAGSTVPLTLKDLSKGMILPGRVTKVSDRQLIVQLNDNLVGAIDLIDMGDDYSQIKPAQFEKNDIVRVQVVGIDVANKKINLSMRPSKVMSSSLPVKDREVTSIDQLSVGEERRGFVVNVADKGIFVMLGHGITAFVMVRNLTDGYVKDWKDQFQRDQLVKGKITAIDKQAGHVQMSLRESVFKPGYVPPKVFSDMQVDDVVTGTVAEVMEYGVFILVDNSENVRGLCHRSEIAETRIPDATKLFQKGDAVKAKILRIIAGPPRKINFGMKASYFADSDSDKDQSDDGSEGGMAVDKDDPLSDDQDGDMLDVHEPSEDGSLGIDEDADQLSDVVNDDATTTKPRSIFEGLSFDINAPISAMNGTSKRAADLSDTDDEKNATPKKKKRRAAPVVDQTGDLNPNNPQSPDDFERLLQSSPDDSILWIDYMSHHLRQKSVDLARSVGEQALKSIGISQDAEKLNIWIALINLENKFGDEDGTSLRTILARALEYNDAKEIHERLASIYISTGKHTQADDLFKEMTRQQKLGATDPKTWINYATFLFDTLKDADRARDLLPQALKILPARTHINITSKFAQLEFRCKTGVPERGRTIFEGLVASFPKRVDLWNILLDLEMKARNRDQVRALFERIFEGAGATGMSGSSEALEGKGKKTLKPKQAKYFFKRWLDFEQDDSENGGGGEDRRIDEVKRRAAEYVRTIGERNE